MNIPELEAKHGTGVYPKREVVIVRGLGAHVWDAEGNEYIDCAGGHGVAALGHSNPYVAAAIREQAGILITCPEIFHNDKRAQLMEKLATITPLGLDRFFLCNSGAEAVEAAFKFARMATGKPGIIATRNGFHGRTFGALSATWEPEYREPFAPLVPGFAHIPYDDLPAAEEAMGEDTAAVIVEIVQGEGGVRPGSPEYFQGLQRLCQEKGVLLIVDEVQTGFGRTGRMFACEHYSLAPDMLCMGKSIAGGVPMAALALGPRVQNIQPMSHGSTFGGNPLACAASLAAIQYMEDYDLPKRAEELGNYLLGRLEALNLRIIREVRGLGLMVGLELRQRVTPYLRALMDKRVLALPAGRLVLRLLPPLVIEKEDLDRVVEAIEEVLTA